MGILDSNFDIQKNITDLLTYLLQTGDTELFSDYMRGTNKDNRVWKVRKLEYVAVCTDKKKPFVIFYFIGAFDFPDYYYKITITLQKTQFTISKPMQMYQGPADDIGIMRGTEVLQLYKLRESSDDIKQKLKLLLRNGDFKCKYNDFKNR